MRTLVLILTSPVYLVLYIAAVLVGVLDGVVRHFQHRALRRRMIWRW